MSSFAGFVLLTLGGHDLFDGGELLGDAEQQAVHLPDSCLNKKKMHFQDYCFLRI